MLMAPQFVAIINVINTGVEAELEAALKLTTSQIAELKTLKEAAATATQHNEVLTHKLESRSEQLQTTKAQLSQLTTEQQQLQQQHETQLVQCSELQSELDSSSSAGAELQRRIQAQTEATNIAQQELQGNFDKYPVYQDFPGVTRIQDQVLHMQDALVVQLLL